MYYRQGKHSGFSTPAERLEKLKAYPYAQEGETWRDTFKAAPWVRDPVTDFTHHAGKLNADKAESYAALFRLTGYADQVACRDYAHGWGIDHTGWYADEIQSETVRGFVVQFPSRDGVPQYYAGADWSDSDCATLHLGESFDDPRDAAVRADEIAKDYAEDAQRYDHAWRKQEERDDMRTAIVQKIAHARLFLAAIDQEPSSGLAVKLLGEQYRSLRKEITEDREELKSFEREHAEALALSV